MRFRPGMGRFLIDAVVHHQIAADIAGRDAQRARGPDEQMGVVLAHPATDAPGILRGGVHTGRAGLVGHLVANAGG